MNIKKIAILGSGSMGGAILTGLLKAGFAGENIWVSTRTEISALKHRDELGVNAFALETNPNANALAVQEADVVLIGVKPAYVTEVLREVADSLLPNALIISVAAGITCAAMQAAVPEGVAIIRSMPNTPAIVGRAITGIARSASASAADLHTAVELFETVGKVIVLDEAKIDALSSISGSGPAYVFYLIEQLTAAAKHHGFTDAESALMVNETFLGAAELLVASGKSPAELRKQVTSPNGTTERAIARMAEAKLDVMFVEATEAAVKRAKELAAGA